MTRCGMLIIHIGSCLSHRGKCWFCENYPKVTCPTCLWLQSPECKIACALHKNLNPAKYYCACDNTG